MEDKKFVSTCANEREGGAVATKKRKPGRTQAFSFHRNKAAEINVSSIGNDDERPRDRTSYVQPSEGHV